MASPTPTTSHIGSYWMGGDIARRYHKYRPVHNEEMIRMILNYMNSGGFTSESGNHSNLETTCVDVGCGSGQSTKIWAPYFKKVYGIDISKEQIKEVEQEKDKPANVQYRVVTAEHLPLPDACVHLIVCFQSLHWFDIPQFLTECERVLVVGGVLALASHTVDFLLHLPSPAFQAKEKELQSSYNKFKQLIGGYWKYNLLSNTYYQDIPLPFKERKSGHNHTDTNIVFKTTITGFLGFLSTFSVVIDYMKENEGVALMEELEKEMMAILLPGGGGSNKDIELHVTLPVYYVFARK